ncbi:hypothetical protein [Cumulibacter manganitolerans]|uniref:hypothetical protein n=1 Tax=Cumulibacter manganitolerans TaxID=1884992 RepID=UPI001296F354|nr:hypothetical protein [Cumulibacter manganitolerans]
MASSGSKKPVRPTVVRRTRAGSDDAKTPAPRRSEAAKSAASRSSAVRQTRAAGPQETRASGAGSGAAVSRAAGRTPVRGPVQAPQLGLSAYVERVPVDRAARVLLPTVGLLSAAGAVLVVVSDFLPYLVLDGDVVRAGQDLWSVLGHLALLVAGLGGGALLLARRGGRVGLALVAALCALAPGNLLLNVFNGVAPTSHDIGEYHFGVLYTTLTIEPRLGRTLAVVGWAALVLAGAPAVAAWRRVAERDLLPLGRGRRFAVGAAGLSVLLAVTAYLIPAALTKIEKYTDRSGLVLTRDIAEPKSLIAASGLGLVAALVLLAGWLVAGAVVGSMTSRATLVASLVGLAAVLLNAALLNARDAATGPDLVPGPRMYLLLLAGLLCAGAAAYAARVQGRDDAALLSDQQDPYT